MSGFTAVWRSSIDGSASAPVVNCAIAIVRARESRLNSAISFDFFVDLQQGPRHRRVEMTTLELSDLGALAHHVVLAGCHALAGAAEIVFQGKEVHDSAPVPFTLPGFKSRFLKAFCQPTHRLQSVACQRLEISVQPTIGGFSGRFGAAVERSREAFAVEMWPNGGSGVGGRDRETQGAAGITAITVISNNSSSRASRGTGTSVLAGRRPGGK